MLYMLVRHRVSDYSKWKSIFDEHTSTRKANGSKGGRLLRSRDNPNELVIFFEWDDLKKVHQFAESDDLRKTMERVDRGLGCDR